MQTWRFPRPGRKPRCSRWLGYTACRSTLEPGSTRASCDASPPSPSTALSPGSPVLSCIPLAQRFRQNVRDRIPVRGPEGRPHHELAFPPAINSPAPTYCALCAFPPALTESDAFALRPSACAAVGCGQPHLVAPDRRCTDSAISDPLTSRLRWLCCLTNALVGRGGTRSAHAFKGSFHKEIWLSC